MKNISVFLLFLSYMVSSCSAEGVKLTVKLPLYVECEKVMRNYVKDKVESRLSSDQKFDMAISRFDRLSEAHPSLIGSVEISATNMDKDEVDLYVNGLATSCFPRHYVSARISESGLKTILNEKARNETQNINANYLVVTDGELRLYFNSKVTMSPKLEYTHGTSVR
jgi:hypothetical protein